MAPWFNFGLFLLIIFVIAMTILLIISWIKRESRRQPVPLKKVLPEFSEELAPLNLRPRFDSGLSFLPHQYGQDIMGLLPRSPFSLYAYWEVSAETELAAASAFDPLEWQNSPWKLRLFDVTDKADFAEAPYVDISIPDGADYWYIHGVNPSHRYRLAVGRLTREGFVTLLLSEAVLTPAAAPSPIIDPEWPPIAALQGKPYQKQNPLTSPAGAWSTLSWNKASSGGATK
ncbi:DUF4912 domain-containing protein [Heliobacterium chlorum]|uniref:DUF4912 domain-containing protein n=1 Tax=Heliobacterium chlorum TaxID=2698 RepID=A0ABR7SZP4_HELCL|nr:DUF4912 domain-containing protein [Heliobacterium chlorum]MBC9784009.1 DUF4912 domain-containing protein [Heliobacterium chlorum]